MINYIEKGIGLHDAIHAAGHSFSFVDNVPVASDEVAVQAIIDSYPLSATQKMIAANINLYAKELRDKIVEGNSPAEMAGWSIKRAEAMAVMVGATQAPVLSLEAAARGCTLADICAKVHANATTLSALEANISGMSGKHRDAVAATTDFATALAYDWHTGWPNI